MEGEVTWSEGDGQPEGSNQIEAYYYHEGYSPHHRIQYLNH